MISCEKDGPYIGFSHCPVCSAKYATEMGKTIRALETALAAMTAERDAAIAELRNIAEADKPCSSLRCEFQAWAQSRARAAVEGER